MTTVSRGLSILAAVVLAAGGNLVLVSPAARATTGTMHLCTNAEIAKGTVMRAITLKHRSFEMTHAERKRIPAHVAFHREVSMSTTKVLKASFEASATVKSDAGAFFAKASVEAGVKVGGEGSRTTSETVTEGFDIGPAKVDRVFVFYTGNDFFRMRAHKRLCNRGGQYDYFGKLRSFSKITENGAVRCPHSRYKTGSIPYQVALNAGC